MRSATFPPIRVEPEVRASVEAVLREGESLTQFIEKAVVDEATWRRTQLEFLARGKAALERHLREGDGVPIDEFFKKVRGRAAATRARLETEARSRRRK